MLAAQEPDPPAPSAETRYEVEIVVFRHRDPDAVGAEETAAHDPATEWAPAGSSWPELPPTALQLTGIVSRLRQSPLYQPILHAGWAQPLAPAALAQPSVLPPAAAAAGLSGSVTVYRDRFTHALVDIALREPGADGSSPGARLRQGRRLRGSAAQYFDHPQFGVILALRAAGAGPAPAASEGREGRP
jgi:hypothetical protein